MEEKRRMRMVKERISIAALETCAIFNTTIIILSEEPDECCDVAVFIHCDVMFQHLL
jgi:hypothetical protein